MRGRLDLCVLASIVAAAKGAHTIGILLPWTASYIAHTDTGSVVYSYSGFGASIQPGITLAFQAIQQDTSLLQEVRDLTWVWHDDGCDAKKSIYATEQLILEYGIEAIIGPSCTTITDTIAEAALYHNIPVIGYSIPSFNRSSSNDLPNLIRTMAPYTSLANTIVGFMDAFNWKYISILYEAGDTTGWEATANVISARLADANITTCSTFFLSASNAGSAASEDSISTAVSQIKANGYRIILIVGSCQGNPKLLAEMYKNSMQVGYAIMTMTSLDDLSCETTVEFNVSTLSYLNNTFYVALEFPAGAKADKFEASAFESYFEFQQYETPPNGTAVRTTGDTALSNPFGLSYAYNIYDAVNLYRWIDEWGYMSYLYDGILLYARALNYTRSHGMNASYQNFLSAIPEVTPFDGAWRSVEFTKTGNTYDRVLEGRVYAFLYFGSVYTISHKPIAWQNSSGFGLFVPKDSIVWPGLSNEIPPDLVITVACTTNDIEYSISEVSPSTLTITAHYKFREDADCDEKDYSFPSDAVINVDQFPAASVIGVVIIMCAILSALLSISIAVFAVTFRKHKLLEKSRLSATCVWLGLSVFASASPLFFLGQPSNALCQLRPWALFLSGFMLSTFMVSRVYQLGVVITRRRKDAEKDSYMIMRNFCLLWNAPLIVMLVNGSSYDPPSSFAKSVQPEYAPLTVIENFGCGNVVAGVFTTILSYFAGMVIYGLWKTSNVLGGLTLAAALWKSNRRVWEVRYLAYCTYITLLGQAILLLTSLFETIVGLDLFRAISTIAISLSASASLSVIWVPRMAIIINENLQSPDDITNPPDSQSNHNALESPAVVEIDTHYNELFHVPNRASGKLTFKSPSNASSAPLGLDTPSTV